MTNLQNQYSDYLKESKILRHSVNGLSRFLVLWIIRYHKDIHGYEIIKELDRFFEVSISEGVLNKTSSSKIYSLLNDMEESELITGENVIQENNKKVKYYSITEKGDFILNYLYGRYLSIFNNPQWKLLFDDFDQ